MKIVRYQLGQEIAYGILRDERIVRCAGTPYSQLEPTDTHIAADSAVLLAPVTPSKILAVGFNYHAHAREFDTAEPVQPNVFIKPLSCLLGPGQTVMLPDRFTQRVDYEAELVIVVGKTARRVPPDQSMEYVLGYTCGNDVTARDMQTKENQWAVCKGFDTFGPVGPWIETEADCNALDIKMYVNGQIRQHGNTGNMIFSVSYLVSYLSQVMTLEAGDIIFTGTPSGVGPVQKGDVMEVVIEGVGALRNPVDR